MLTRVLLFEVGVMGAKFTRACKHDVRFYSRPDNECFDSINTSENNILSASQQ